MAEESEEPPRVLRLRITICVRRCAKAAHKAELPLHAAYLGFLGFGFHELYAWAALVLFVVIIISAFAGQGGGTNV